MRLLREFSSSLGSTKGYASPFSLLFFFPLCFSFSSLPFLCFSLFFFLFFSFPFHLYFCPFSFVFDVLSSPFTSWWWGVLIRGRGERATLPLSGHGIGVGWLGRPLCSHTRVAYRACRLCFFISMVGYERSVGYVGFFFSKWKRERERRCKKGEENLIPLPTTHPV